MTWAGRRRRKGGRGGNSSSSTDNDDASRSLYYPPARNETIGLGEERPLEELVVLQEANSTASSLDVQVDDIIYDIEDVMMLSVAPPPAADSLGGRVEEEGADLEVILGT
ncbi:hypothetical protein ZHAS_00008991 [Anopheles sinensis]|uniref:Uncharacterized protein n=1 Tax=Anopheles sinensis TaxID=74873 RepID=A0A084VTW2_ANOSI|nr:hypothetical protein ZHAS_00008991 [Anopheles sinensis]